MTPVRILLLEHDHATYAELLYRVQARRGPRPPATEVGWSAFLYQPVSTVRRVFSTNVIGSFLAMREVAKVMVSGGYGRIVNFATVATPLNLEGESAYAASKAAIESLTRVAARELASFGITVNAVGPTPVMTDLVRSVPRQKMDALVRLQAVRRMGEYRDVTHVIDFLASRDSDFITGQTLYLGGVS